MLRIVFIVYVLFVAGGCGSSKVAANKRDIATQLQEQPGLVAFWDFSDSSGRAVSGSSKGLQLTGANNNWVAEGPLSGHSLQLDGQKDFWYIPHAASKGLDIKSNRVTVIAWVKWTGGTGFVAGKWNEHEGDGGRRQYGLFISLPYYNGASQVCGHISKNGGPTAPFPYSIDYSASPQKVPLSEWVCVAFTYDGQYIRSYFNGVFQARQPELIQRTAGFLKDKPDGLIQTKNPYYYPDGMGNNGSDFTVGAVRLKNGMGNFFKGNIGGIAVFDKALSDADMQRLAVMPGR